MSYFHKVGTSEERVAWTLQQKTVEGPDQRLLDVGIEATVL